MGKSFLQRLDDQFFPASQPSIEEQTQARLAQMQRIAALHEAAAQNIDRVYNSGYQTVRATPAINDQLRMITSDAVRAVQYVAQVGAYDAPPTPKRDVIDQALDWLFEK